MVGRPSTVLTVQFLRSRHRRHLPISCSIASGFAQRHRWNQPHRVVGVVEDRSEVRLIADAVPLVVEVADAGDFVPGSLSDRVVEDDVAILRPACFAVFLEFFKSFVVELLFVPVVLGEKLVESAFVPSWKDFACGCCADDSDSNSLNTRVHDKKPVIGIICLRCRLRHAPTSTFKAELRRGTEASSFTLSGNS